MSKQRSIAAAHQPLRLLRVEHDRVGALVINSHLPDLTGHRLLPRQPRRLRALPGLVHGPALMDSADRAPDDGHRTAPSAFVTTFVLDGPKPLVVVWMRAEVLTRLGRPWHWNLAFTHNARR